MKSSKSQKISKTSIDESGRMRYFDQYEPEKNLYLVGLFILIVAIAAAAAGIGCTKQGERRECYECLQQGNPRDWHEVGCYTEREFDTLHIENKWSCRQRN